MQGSPCLNPVDFCDLKTFLMKKENISSNNNLSRIFPHIGRRETGL